jgi:hypothetical protein
MELQNITVSLPKVLLKRARSLAMTREESIDELMRELLEERIRRVSEYKKAQDRQMRILEMGLNLNTRGSLCIPREELHER